GRWTGLLALGVAVLAVWNDPARRLVEGGDVTTVAIGAHAVLHLSLLARYHRRPGPVAWAGLVLTAAAGWYLDPTIWAGVLALGAAFWLGVGRRHGAGWHAGLLLAYAAAGGAAAAWVTDWVLYWWIHLPLRAPATSATACRDWWDLWASPGRGGAGCDRL